MVNGHVASLALSGSLHTWLQDELARKELDRSWLDMALVRIRYSRDTDRVTGGAYFDAVALVRSAVGVFKGEFSNSQALVGAWLRRA
jgi:hypothetical protein